MGLRFRHLDHDWEAESAGTGHGVGPGYHPSVTRWGVVFRCVSDPTRGPYFSHIPKPDPAQVAEEDLKRILEKVVTKADKG